MAKKPIYDRLERAWSTISDNVLNPKAQDIDVGKNVADLARERAQVVWLLGKVQSGKSSIIKALTGVEKVKIGEGFAACTKRSYVYDFPSDAPIIRFLDTRGLGEVAYDASEDMAWCEDQAHLLLVVMRAADAEQELIVRAVGDVRQRHPDWPVIIAQTCLHTLYPPGRGHVLPYPFTCPNSSVHIPQQLRRALALQRSLFKNIRGAAPIEFVPIDFLPEEEGFVPHEYGLSALEKVIQKTAPLGLIAARYEQAEGWEDSIARRALRHILGYASAAGVADIVPAVGIVAVPLIQAKLLHSLASFYGTHWNRQRLTEFASALGFGAGARYATGFLTRQFSKLIPGYGQTAGATFAAAMSFATTFALGKAAGTYLAHRRLSKAFTNQEISEAYAKALEEAFEIAKKQSWRKAMRSDKQG